MRWLWIDGFVDFVSGRSAAAVKNVSLAEDYLHDHFPGHPVFPPPLMIEGMAQTAGILVGEARGFGENVILAKIRQASFTGYAGPGDQLRYDATLDSIDDRAGVTSGTVRRNGEIIGHINLIFSHVRPGVSVAGLPEHNFVFTEQFMTLFEDFKGRAAKGGF